MVDLSRISANISTDFFPEHEPVIHCSGGQNAS